MTDPLYQHDILIVDRSGSMRAIQRGAQEGLEGFIATAASLEAPQGPLRKVTVSIWDFDTEIRCVSSVTRAGYLTGPGALGRAYQLVPRGGTALLDAIGRAVTTEGEKLAALPEDQRPGQVTVLIVSDGEENSSHEWGGEQVAALLEQQQRQWKWQVQFIGTNMDVLKEAGKLSVPYGSAMRFDYSSAGTKSAFGSAGASLTRYATATAGGQVVNMTFTEQERTAAAKPDEDGTSGSEGGA